MKKIFLLVCFCIGMAFSQQSQLPFVIGGTLDLGTGVMNDNEASSGIVRITPFAGAWIQGLGYLRVGYGMFDFTSKADGGEKYSVKHRDLSVLLGISLGPGPYLQGSYTRAKNLSAIGDVSWHEWGIGIGTTFPLSPMAALVTELYAIRDLIATFSTKSHFHFLLSNKKVCSPERSHTPKNARLHLLPHKFMQRWLNRLHSGNLHFYQIHYVSDEKRG